MSLGTQASPRRSQRQVSSPPAMALDMYHDEPLLAVNNERFCMFPIKCERGSTEARRWLVPSATETDLGACAPVCAQTRTSGRCTRRRRPASGPVRGHVAAGAARERL